jgi:hypothetical protein
LSCSPHRARDLSGNWRSCNHMSAAGLLVLIVHILVMRVRQMPRK